MNLENYCIHRRHRLFGQTTKQPFNNFDPKNLENISNFEGLGLILVASKKKISVRMIEAELLKQYVISLKEVVCKYRANRNEMKQWKHQWREQCLFRR